MPEPVTLAVLAAATLVGNALKDHVESAIKDAAFSFLDDSFEKRPQDLYREPIVKSAAQKTAAQFPELRQEQLPLIIEQWCNSGKFAQIYTEFKKHESDISEQRIIAGFVDTARGFERTNAVSQRAEAILIAFFRFLKERTLASDEGLVYKDFLDEARFEQLSLQVTEQRSENQTLVLTNFELAQTNAELTRRLLSVTAPAAPETRNSAEVELQSTISIALKLSENGKFDAGAVLVNEIRAHAEFGRLSNGFQARVATIAAKCAEELGENETAIRELELALTLTPDELRAISNGAAAALQQKQWQRAVDLAHRARDLDASDENAFVILVQGLGELGDYEAIEKLLARDPGMSGSAIGLTALASVRLKQSLDVEAIWLTRKAVSLRRDWIPALEQLYEACFHPIQEIMMKQGALQRTHATMRRLQLAQAAIARAARLMELSPNRGHLHRLLVNQAVIANARGRCSEALEVCDRVLRDRPQPGERDAGLSIKGFVLFRLGRYQEATTAFESVTNREHHSEISFGLAQCWVRVQRPEEAATLFEEIWKPEQHSNDAILNDFFIAESLIEIYHSQDQVDKVNDVISRLKSSFPNHSETRAVEAEARRLGGDFEGAVALLRQAIADSEAGNEKDERELWVRLGDWLYKASNFEEAANAWANVDVQFLARFYLKAYLHALYSCGRYEKALEVAQTLRQREGFVPRAIEIQAAILAYAGERERARHLYQELIQHEPHNPLHLVNEAQIALQDDDSDAALSLLGRIEFNRVKTDAPLLRRIAAMQSFLGLSEALPFAFRARQIDYGNPESHRLYVSIFLKLTNLHSLDEDGNVDNGRAGRVLGLGGPEWGTTPCTLRMAPVETQTEEDTAKSDDEADDEAKSQPTSNEGGGEDESEWMPFTILLEGPFDRAHGFYSPDDPLSLRLLAMRSNDTIRLYSARTKSEQLFRVGSVLHPFFHAFQESNQRSAELFPDGSSSLRTIDVKQGFDELWLFIRQHSEALRYWMDGYKDWTCPLSLVAHQRGKSYLDVWNYVCSSQSIGLHAQRGTFEEWEQSFPSLESESADIFAASGETENRSPLVLEWSSLLALTQWDLQDVIGPHFRYLVPESLLREVRNSLEETAGQQEKAIYLVPTEQGNHVVESSLEEQQAKRDQLQRILDFINANALVLPPKAVIRLHPNKVEEWTDVMGRSTVDSAILALEHNATLYADDAVLRRFLPFLEGLETVRCCATQGLLEVLRRAGKLSEEDYFEVLEVLLLQNYRFAIVEVKFFLWLLQKHDYHLTAGIRAAFGVLEAPHCVNDAAISVTAHIISILCQQDWSKEQLSRLPKILELILLSLITGRQITPTLTQLCVVLANPHFVFHKEPSALNAITLWIMKWHFDVVRAVVPAKPIR